MIELMNRDNKYLDGLHTYSLAYCDYIYENLDFSWVNIVWDNLDEDGILIAQTDWHSAAEYKVYVQNTFKDATFVNWLSFKCEWGNHPKDRFHQCYDDIIIFCKGKKWKFYSNRIQVPKATAKTKLNPSGRETKTATAWIDDICLTTTSKERVKKDDGHLIRWQKPLKLYDRIIAPFTDENDWILDPFMGSGSLGKWCKLNNRNYTGIEYDKEVFELAYKNIEGEQ